MHAVYRLLLLDVDDPALERHVAESDVWIESHPSSADPYIRTLWLLVLCVHGRYDLALEQSDALGDRLYRIVPFVHVADHVFLRGFAAAALATSESGKDPRRWMRALRESLRRLRGWARSGPDFVHMVLLLEAECARHRGSVESARLLYQQAAVQARKQSFLHHAALIHERRGSLLLGLRRYTESESAIADAVALYREWGALPKANALAGERNRG
jgi:hypothetical protein